MTSANRIHHLLYRGSKILADPGASGTIRPTADLQICEMVSGADAETRTLANPTKPGIRFVLRMLTDGGGAITVTAENGLNAAAETTAVFADAGDFLSLVSVTTVASTTYRWEIMEGNSGTSISTSTPTATATSTGTSTSTPSSSGSASATSTGTSTSTSTGTSTSSSTFSISGSDTASHTASASKSSSKTATATSTPTSTSTSTGTSSTSASSTGTKTSTSTATATPTP